MVSIHGQRLKTKTTIRLCAIILPSLIVWLGWWICWGNSSAMDLVSIPDVDEYWPEVANDLSLVTWSHATNSQALLREAIGNDTIKMIEADVVMGQLTGGDGSKLPIMAHPPHVLSDLSLEMFVYQVTQAVAQGEVKKGIKLDFKQLEVVRESLDTLNSQRENLEFPIWLNADILAGPVEAPATPVNAEAFLTLCVEFFSEATLSLGWTTRFTNGNDSAGQYTTANVKEMVDTIENNHVTQPITFPVRAAFVERSSDSLTWLINSVPDSTLTVWSSSSDSVNIPSLVWLQEMIGADAVYMDLPPEQQREFDSLRPNTDDTSSANTAGATVIRVWPKGTVVWASVAALVMAALVSLVYGVE